MDTINWNLKLISLKNVYLTEYQENIILNLERKEIKILNIRRFDV